jgi:hypothetical protein
MPMGLSMSCNVFEEFSTALQYILQNKFHVPSMTHIVDDFMFFGPHNSSTCQESLQSFLTLAKLLNIPIKQSKTCPPSTLAQLHGIEVDTVKMEARLPQDKLHKAVIAIQSLAHCKKTTLRQFQSTLGFLNFACRVVTPGRPFLRRLFDLTRGVVCKHHRIRITKPARLDLEAWLAFTHRYNGVTLLRQQRWESSPKLNLYSDAAASLGYAAVLDSKWILGSWPLSWSSFHISVLEMYPITVAVELWGSLLANKCIIFHCDNQAVCYIVNNQTASDPNIMPLVRRLVVATMTHNILVRADFVRGVDNTLADNLSRFQIVKARRLAPWLDNVPCQIPPHLLPENILQQPSWQQLWHQVPK